MLTNWKKNIRENKLTRDLYQLIYIILRRTPKKLVRKLARKLILKNPIYFERLLPFLEIRAIKKKNYRLLSYVAPLLYAKKEFQRSFDCYFLLLQLSEGQPKEGWINRLLVCENRINESRLYNYFHTYGRRLPEPIYFNLLCSYAQDKNDLTVDWEELAAYLKRNNDPLVTTKAIFTAFALQNFSFISDLRDQILSSIDFQHRKDAYRCALTAIAACYYRSGQCAELVSLGRRVDYAEIDWALYQAFAKGQIMEAMNIRAQTIERGFSLHYPHKLRPNQAKMTVLLPEKDLCGEAFNGMFYKALSADVKNLVVVCDARLHGIYSKNYPEIEFIAKTPRYLQHIENSKFDRIPTGLRDYLDNSSYKKIAHQNIINLNYLKYSSSESTQENRISGWLKPDKGLIQSMKEKLPKGKKLVGIASNSTVRSRIRDIHMIGMEHWDPILKLPNCHFISLNTNLTEQKRSELEARLGASIWIPEFDLHNDFDSLLALMSILDIAILPANNMMDFASAVGTKTIIFSPSNIMKVWRKAGTQEYIFSENVRFIFPNNELMSTSTIETMVHEGVELIEAV